MHRLDKIARVSVASKEKINRCCNAPKGSEKLKGKYHENLWLGQDEDIHEISLSSASLSPHRELIERAELSLLALFYLSRVKPQISQEIRWGWATRKQRLIVNVSRVKLFCCGRLLLYRTHKRRNFVLSLPCALFGLSQRRAFW